MSNKYGGIYVTFEREMTEEYVENIKQLIGLIKGVISVEEKVSDVNHWMAREQIKHEIRMKLFEVLK